MSATRAPNDGPRGVRCFPLACLRGAVLPVLVGLCLVSAACSTPTASTGDSAPDTSAQRLERAARYSAAHAGDALLVWADGHLVLERAQNGYNLDRPHMLASGTKSFVGVAALAAAADGVLALDERVAETIRTWQDDPQRSSITVRQLLHLTSGLDPGGAGRAPTFDGALQVPVLDPPGTTFRYGPTAFQVFGALLQRKLGGEDPRRYIERRLFDPLEIQAGGWAYVDGQDPQLAGGARLRARDWLRFGRLLLNNGQWNGTSVVPPSSLDVLVRPTAASPGYGLTVWLNAAVDTSSAFFEHAPRTLHPDGPQGMIYNDGPRDLYMAAGLFNQRLYVIPSRNMVVVRLGRADPTWSDAEFLARLLDGRPYQATARKRLPLEERVALLATLRIQQLDAAVSLTDAQENAVRPIVERQLRELDTIRREQRPGALLRLRALQRRTDRAIEAELTASQREAYRSFRAEQREQRREGGWRRR